MTDDTKRTPNQTSRRPRHDDQPLTVIMRGTPPPELVEAVWLDLLRDIAKTPPTVPASPTSSEAKPD